MPVASCRSEECQAPIVFGLRHDMRTVKMPFDVGSEDDPAGEYAIWMDGDLFQSEMLYRKLGEGEEPNAAKGERRAVSHYRTCKKANDWSAASKPKPPPPPDGKTYAERMQEAGHDPWK